MQDFQEDDVSETIPQVSIPVHRRRSHKTPELNDTYTDVKHALSILNDDVDECDLYGKLLAKKLRQYTDLDRQELMYEIDGLLLKKKRQLSNLHNNSQPTSPINAYSSLSIQSNSFSPSMCIPLFPKQEFSGSHDHN